MHVPPPAITQPVRLVALDMDGTLLSPDGTVSPRARDALGAALAAGIEIVIATGRRHTYAMRQLRALGLPEQTLLISSNGAVIRSLDATLIERTHMSREATLRLFAALGDFRNALVVTFDRVTPTGDDLCGSLVVEELDDLHTSLGKWIESNASSIQHVRPIEQCLEPTAQGLEPPAEDPEPSLPIQAMLCGTIARMRAAEALLHTIPGVQAMSDLAVPPQLAEADTPPAADIVLHRTEYPARDLSIVDILPAGISKGTTLSRLLAARGFTPANLMAVGDNWNDLPMLSLAGVPVLMGNAPADLLEQARSLGWFIAPSNERDGAADAIEAALAHNARLAASAAELEPTLVTTAP